MNRETIHLGCLWSSDDLLDLSLGVHADEPLVLEALLDPPARLRIRVKHVLDQRPCLARKVVERRRDGVGVLAVVGGDVGGERPVGLSRDSPRKLLELHAVEHDSARPDVDQTGVVLCKYERR